MNAISVSSSVRLMAPSELVWGIIADYRFDAEWREGVVSMTQDTLGVVVDGTRTVEEFTMLGQRMINIGIVDGVEPGRRFHWRTVEGTDAEGTRAVVPGAGGSCTIELTLTSRPRGAAENILRPLLRPALQKSLDRSLERLRPMVERSAAQAS